jgi:deoxyxylulose-5-phosphate synthase
MSYLLLAAINDPADLRRLEVARVPELAQELRDSLLQSVTATGAMPDRFGAPRGNVPVSTPAAVSKTAA